MKLILYVFLLIITVLFLIYLYDNLKKKKIVNEYSGKDNVKGKLENINGTTIYYEEKGKGIPLLIIHGFMASTTEYTEIIDILSKDFKVIAVDLIGFGKSDKNSNLDYSKKNMSDLIAALLIKKGYKEVNVLGHSMGGEVTLNLAYYHSNIVKSIVLLDSVGQIDINWPQLPVWFFKGFFKMYIIQKLFYKYCLHNQKFYNPEKFERVFYFNCFIPPESIKSFSSKNDRYKIGDKIKEIYCPTLILWGKHDRIVPLKSAYKFKEDIKGSELVIFENSGHIPYTEEEDEFIKTIKQFLCRHNE